MSGNVSNIGGAIDLDTNTQTLIVLYNIIVILIGGLGNVVVLYCSMRHCAIEMDRSTLIFIENLAMADIFITVFYYTPMLITIIMGEWVFSGWFCWFVGFISSHIPFLAEILVIMSISCYRLWVVRRPPGLRKKSHETQVKIAIAIIWSIASIPVIYWVARGAGSFYSAPTHICNSSNHRRDDPTFLSTKIFSIIYVAIPMVVVFLTNIRILCIVTFHTLKLGRSLMPHIKTVTTVSLICWAFFLSYVPIFVRMVLNTLRFPLPPWFLIFQVYCKSVHVVVNPFIYVATNTRFRRYIRFRVYRYTYMQPGDTDPVNYNVNHVSPPHFNNGALKMAG